MSSGSPSLCLRQTGIIQSIWTGISLISRPEADIHTSVQLEFEDFYSKVQGNNTWFPEWPNPCNTKTDKDMSTSVTVIFCHYIQSNIFLFSFRSLHLQLHGRSSHLRLPGRPLQQKGHPELWHFLLVHCYSVELLHQQRGTALHAL